MPTPLSLEQRILIAAEYNADRVEVIKELMEEAFEAGRLTHPLAGMKYDTFEDYQKNTTH